VNAGDSGFVGSPLLASSPAPPRRPMSPLFQYVVG
jgi:hypothetical protein